MHTYDLKNLGWRTNNWIGSCCSLWNNNKKNTRDVKAKIEKWGTKREEEYVPGSILWALIVKKEVKFITFLEYKEEFG